MTFSLSPKTQKLLDDHMKKGGYRTAEDVIRAGLASLELHGDFEAGELDALLAEGEAEAARGELIDGDAVFRELEQRSIARRREQSS